MMQLPCFPGLTSRQKDQLDALEDLYREWNDKINVISRKDIEHFRVRHLLHSLSIALIHPFLPGTRIMDAGSGGGLPGIPLAILFPESTFTLVDSIAKKITVIDAVSRDLGLTNLETRNERFERVRGPFDFVTGRAVTSLPVFTRQVKNSISKNGFNALPNGILYLTGGDIEPALDQTGCIATVWQLREFYDDPYFETKKLVHLAVVPPSEK